MIEIYLKYDSMHIFRMINALNCINNNVISCINSMLSVLSMPALVSHQRVDFETVLMGSRYSATHTAALAPHTSTHNRARLHTNQHAWPLSAPTVRARVVFLQQLVAFGPSRARPSSALSLGHCLFIEQLLPALMFTSGL